MAGLILPFVFVTLLWFFSTGAIVWLNKLPRETHPASITAATPLAGAAVCGLLVSLTDTAPAGAYLAFACALVLWGWHEMSFLMGFVSGPRRVSCPEGVRGWARFRVSTETVIHHEVAIAVTLLVLTIVSWGQPNALGVQVFALLFALRLSTKLNIFLGVANLSDDLMPAHLAYLKSYFRARRFNALFPLSIAASLALAAWLGGQALAATPGTGAATAYAMLLALTLLGIAEHVLMMIPLRDSALWQWATPKSARMTMTGRS